MKKVLSVVLWVIGAIAVIHQTNDYTHIEENILAITKSTIAYIKDEEGVRNKAYKDSKGLWTIGVGHLIKNDETHLLSKTLTDDEVDELLRSDLRWCSAAVEGSVKVPLSQEQFDALYSLCFNIGETNFKRSTVVRRLNQSDYQGAADAILMWNKPPELMKRRRRERDLFLAGL